MAGSAVAVDQARSGPETAPLLPWLDAPLSAALRTRRSHALLLHGPRGVGQFELALAIANAWLCETAAAERPGGLACGHCVGCRLFASKTHPDLLVLLPEALQDSLGWQPGDAADDAKANKAKPSKDIKVEAVRGVIAFAQQTATRGAVKVALLYPAERMNSASANMLLKTLEEPAGGARFLLGSAQPQRLPPTVRSRCQALAVPLPARDVALEWLATRKVDRADVVLAAAGGQPLDAMDRLALGIDAASWLAMARAVAAGQSQPLASWPLPQAVDALQKLCHDALMLALGTAPRYFPAAVLPADGDIAALTALGQSLRRAARQAEHPWNAGLAIEALVLQTARALSPPAGAGRAAAAASHAVR